MELQLKKRRRWSDSLRKGFPCIDSVLARVNYKVQELCTGKYKWLLTWGTRNGKS